MPSVQDQIVIARPPETVFASLADPAVQMTYDAEIRSIIQLSPGPVARGTRFRGDFKGLGQREIVYAELEPDRLIEHAVKLPFGAGRHRFELRPEGEGTRLVQTITLSPNVLGRILWPLFISRMLTKRVSSLNGLVKAHAEQ